MNYYEHHLGDYAKDTLHLTMIEHGAYRLLLDRYYATEQGIPEDQAHRVARARTREEKQAVDTILSEFFTLDGDVWINGRAEEEIQKAKVRIDAAKNNGKRGGRPKKNPMGSISETEEKPDGFVLGSISETQSKAHQAPDTRHQAPDTRHQTPDTRHQTPYINPPPPGGVAAKPPTPKRATQLPPDFTPNDTGVSYADLKRVAIAVELESFRNWHRAKGTTMKDWQAAWRTWCDKAVEFGRANGARASPNRPESLHDKRARAMEELTGQRRASNERNEIDITGEAVRVA